jgi:hypothetical protein
MWRLGFAVGLLLSLWLVGCKGQDNFIQQSASEFFTVDFNPDYIDVLWVVDDRSPMNNIKTKLVAEASRFFERLDGSTAQYRMGIISADSRFAKGQLKPDGAGVILTKNYGTVQQRSQSFGSILAQVINLHTGGEANGLAASLMALRSTFMTVPGAPLVIVYISDGDDHSEIANREAVDYYAEELTKIKGKKELLRIYSINLKELAGQPKSDTNRCTTLDQAEIDVLSHFSGSQPTFEDRYFRLADKLGGEKAELCGSFASLINLDGLKLKELPNRFRLKTRPNPKTIHVTLFRGEEALPVPAWTYEPATNEIVFSVTPPAGTTVYVSFDSSDSTN